MEEGADTDPESRGAHSGLLHRQQHRTTTVSRPSLLAAGQLVRRLSASRAAPLSTRFRARSTLLVVFVAGCLGLNAHAAIVSSCALSLFQIDDDDDDDAQ